MRRLFISTVLIIASLAACQKDPSGGRSVRIDTAALYTNLEITEDVQSRLNTHSGTISDSEFVYGESGKLITRLGTESSSLGTVSLDIPKLDNGAYTLVAFQSFKDAGGETGWFSADGENLTTLRIMHADGPVEGYRALGVPKETLTVSNASPQMTIVPQAAGSIVDFQLEGYTKDRGDGDLPPVWLCGDTKVIGLYPGREDGSRWMVSPEQQEIIGSRRESQSSQKFFTLLNGDEKTITVCGRNESPSWVYYQAELNLSPGSQAVCYYSFAPETFYNAFCGTPEEAEAFKAAQAGGDCSLDPCLEWGTTQTEVGRYLRSRAQYACAKEEKIQAVSDLGTFVHYYSAPGLSEIYFFPSTETTNLSSVSFLYKDGCVTVSHVETCMLKKGFRYVGKSGDEQSCYMSPDNQTILTLGPGSDVISAQGCASWSASFYPSTPDNLAMLGIE